MADVIFNCPRCQQKLSFSDTLIGSTIACPTCQNNIALEADDTPEPVAPPPSLVTKCLLAQQVSSQNSAYRQAPMQTASPVSPQLRAPTAPNKCPFCQHEIAAGCVICINCGTNLKTGQPASAPPQVSDKRPCPFCGEEIMQAAVKCRHCGEFLNKGQVPPGSGQRPPPQSTQKNGLVILGYLLALLFPIGGFVVSIILLVKSRVGHGLACMATSIFFAVFWFMFGSGMLLAVLHGETEASRHNTCINHLRIIDAAKEQWAMANNKDNGAYCDWDNVVEYMGSKNKRSVCPSGGTYTIGKIGEDPSCSVHGKVSSP